MEKSLSFNRRAEITKNILHNKKVFDNAKQLVRTWQMRMLRVIEVQRPQDFVRNIPPKLTPDTDIQVMPGSRPAKAVRPPE